jgi:diguanylate cyclase (GGDEF)-like protein/PAS domain S-box-containing protein
MRSPEAPTSKPTSSSDWRYFVAVVSVSLGLTIALFLTFFGWEVERRESASNIMVKDRGALVQLHMKDLFHSLQTISRFVENSNAVSPAEFSGFAHPTLRDHPEAVSIQWLRAGLAEGEDQRFRVSSTESAGVSPPAEIQRAVREAMLTSRRLSVSAPFVAKDGQKGILVAVPILPAGADFGAGSASPRGMILATVRVDTLFQDVLSGTHPIGVDEVLRDASAGEVLHYWPSRSRPADSAPSLETVMSRPRLSSQFLVVADRHWGLDFYPAPAFMKGYSHQSSYIALFVGLLASGALGFSTYLLVRSHRRVEELVVLRTRQAREREAYLRAIIDNQPFLVWLKDTESRFLAVNQVFAQACKLADPQALVGQSDLDIWPRDLAEKYRAEDRLVMTSRQQKIVEGAVELSEGRRGWFETYKTPVLDDAGKLLGTAGFARDITERKEVEERLREAVKVLEVTTEAIMVTDPKGIIKMVNPAFTEITGYSRVEVIGQTPRLLKSGRHDQGYYERLWGELRQSGHWEGEVWNRRKNGKVYPEWQSISAVHDKDGQVAEYVSVFSDITRRKLTEEEIRYRANFDPLTGLPNRSLLMERLTQAIKQSQREKERMAILFLDLDHFKEINDTLGHAQGDLLLKQAADRLRQCVRDTDTVARQGGDEFVILLHGLEQASDAELVASKTITSIGEPFDLEGHAAHIGVSIGITLFPDDGDDVTTLFRNADLAMYRAKGAGRNTFQFYEAAMTATAMARRHLEADLRLALARGEFVLHYQPVLDLASGQVCGAEALIRWNHPERGLVPPGAFIPLAEETGLIRDMGAWVLDEACRQLAQWRASGLKTLYVAVNLSSRQITDALSPHGLNELLSRHGLGPNALVLEITEGVLLADTEKTRQWLKSVHDLGYRISLDDFGTGYSSLAYLKRFPVDMVKIDQAFVRDMEHDPADRALVEAILAMARSLGLGVVAEGVENGHQLELLRGLECRYVQGYHLSRPLPAEGFAAYMAGRAGTAEAPYSTLRSDGHSPG